jgi:hypothetical protein
MRKISAIISVYNEEKLLPLCLNTINDYVDEIVIIDGSIKGSSTDNTKSIVTAFDKVIYKSGTFKTIPGAWDITSQRNVGISNASGDILLFLSADMLFYNIEYLCDQIRKEEKVKIFFCPTIEFWIDVNHIRLYENLNSLSMPSGINEAVAISKDLQPMAGDNGSLEVVNPKSGEQMLINNTLKFHLGWIRPFQEQIDKHIRHVNQGRWSDIGEKLLSGAEQKLVQWAILHVLSYKQIPSIDFRFIIPQEWKSLEDMSYLDGQTDVLTAYEKKFGGSVFRGLKI